MTADPEMERNGFATFAAQELAYFYLRNLPKGYEGRAYRMDGGKWAVSYRRTA
jgi:hypothetical protein